MPRTEAGARLTSQHRRAQLAVRARMLTEFKRLWPLWKGTRSTFGDFVDAAGPLIRSHNRVSAGIASRYFEHFREAEQIGGKAEPQLAEPVDPEEVEASLLFTGQEMTRRAVLSGKSPQAAMQTALIRTSGTASRLTLDGGRKTIALSAFQDPRARGYGRVTSSDPCAFCAMIASRGPTYTEDSVEFEAHDHCACSGEPFYDGAEWPGRGREFARLWNEHATGNNQLNEFRRALSGAE